MTILTKDKDQQRILNSHIAEAFDFVTQSEKMSVYDYNNELFENGLAFLHECQIEEFKNRQVFWDWFVFRYRLHDLEYMHIPPSKREPYRIWKLGIVTNENFRKDCIIHLNRNYYELRTK